MQMKTVSAVAALCLALLGAACGGSSSGATTTRGSGGSGAGGGSSGTAGGGTGGAGGGSADDPAWDAYCTSHVKACDDGDADRIAACQGEHACALDFVRADALKLLTDCLATTCDDSCLSGAVAKTTPSTAAKSFQAACQAFVAQCPSLNDDDCQNAAIVTDATIAKYQACLSNDCAAASDCFNSVDDSVQTGCGDWL